MISISYMFARLVLVSSILAFGLYFSWYGIQRYQTLNAYTADLSLIDQAIWNTGQGHFLEATWGNKQQPRTAEHFEPLLIPLAAIYWFWDDVRAILVVQAFALALGALPVFWIAQDVLGRHHFIPRWIPLAFPILYLLSPPLQAAAVADFHADPLMVAPWLFTFWYVTQQKWRWAWVWAIVVMLSKENMPTLIVMMGGYLIVTGWLNRKRESDQYVSYFKHGTGFIVVGIAWFLIATFVIVAPLAEVYFGTNGPIYLDNRFSSNPLDWLAVLSEPDRLKYLLGLAMTTGGLAVLAPQYLLLGLPIFVANVFSNFAGQYSGEQHYSAPLVAVIVVAAIYGTNNMARLFGNKSGRRIASPTLVSMLVLGAFVLALVYQTRVGWTPISRRAEIYTHTTHTDIAHQLFSLVPPDVPISASAGLHPHLSHRRVAYTYPTVEDAAFILADVTDIAGIHPNDVRSQLESYISSRQWQVIEAEDGFMLLKRIEAAPQTLPDQFYSFVRSGENIYPSYPIDLTFANQIRLLGFDVLDDPFHQQTTLRFYWQSLSDNLNEELILWPQFFDDFGNPINDPATQSMVETTWYPPASWQKDEIIVTKTLQQNLGAQFHLAIGVTQEKGFSNSDQNLPLDPVMGADQNTITFSQNTLAHIASFTRDNWTLTTHPPSPTFEDLRPVRFSFEDQLHLIGLHVPASIQSNEPLSILLAWQTDQLLNTDYTIFVHLIDQDGTIVAQNDSQPFWITDQPMTHWQPGQMMLDRHMLQPPFAPGHYQVRMGLYDWQSLDRLPLANGVDSIVIGDLNVD
ncbi:MAG: DUF2079 domain-containing protein [Chloroflexota bacterium]